MEHLASYQRKAFLKDHPPVFARALLGSTGAEQMLLAGTVLGIKKDGKQYVYVDDEMEAHSILAENVIVPPSGGQYTLTYAHAAVVAPELIWDSSVTATQQQAALADLRLKGIFAAEA
ncbi:MAG: head decoration protein [Desulfobulbus sp.]|nr:head decoration protein [Desulfobulbus sp.]